jgi:hypothetical protein
VLKVVRNNLFRIRFEDVKMKAGHDYGAHDLRKKGAAPPADSAKEAAAAPVCAPAQAEAANEAAPAPASAPPPVASANEGGSKCTVDSTLKSTPAFQVNDRVEAFWRDDGEWHPAEVLKVVPNNRFRIRFDGYREKYVFKVQRLRVPEKGIARDGGGAAVSDLQTFQDSLNAIAESLKQRLKTAAPADNLRHRVQAEAAVQHESRSVDERAQAPVSDKLHDSRTSEEQVRQTLAVQHCGS